MFLYGTRIASDFFPVRTVQVSPLHSASLQKRNVIQIIFQINHTL